MLAKASGENERWPRRSTPSSKVGLTESQGLTAGWSRGWPYHGVGQWPHHHPSLQHLQSHTFPLEKFKTLGGEELLHKDLVWRNCYIRISYLDWTFMAKNLQCKVKVFLYLKTGELHTVLFAATLWTDYILTKNVFVRMMSNCNKTEFLAIKIVRSPDYVVINSWTVNVEDWLLAR